MKTLTTFIQTFLRTDPEGAARALETVDPADAARLLAKYPSDAVAAVLERANAPAAAGIIEAMKADSALTVIGRMNPRTVSRILNQMPEDRRLDWLARLPEESATQARKIMHYPADSAGGIMDPRVVTLNAEATVADAIKRIRKAPKETVHYLYVADANRKLVGITGLRDLLLAEPKARIADLMRGEVTSVPVDTDREEIATLIRQKRYFSLPVVDEEGRVAGVVKADQVVRIAQQEAFEDIQKMVGAGGEERATSTVPVAVRKRLPWLIVNLATAFLAAATVGIFEDVIAAVTALAVLLPVVAGQGGNTGSQSLAVVMRGLALKEIVPGTARHVVFKELFAASVNGVAVAVVTAGVVFVWSQSAMLALVIGMAMVVNMASAGLSGALIPLTLKKFGLDPAQSSAIFLTTVTDVVGFASFLGFALLFQPYLV